MFRHWYVMLNELGTWLQINGIVISMWFCMIRPHFTARRCGIFDSSQLLKFHSNEMWSKTIEISNSWGWFHLKMNRYEFESGFVNDIKNCLSTQFQLFFFHLFVCLLLWCNFVHFWNVGTFVWSLGNEVDMEMKSIEHSFSFIYWLKIELIDPSIQLIRPA